MPGNNPFRVQGRIVEVLKPGLARVTLPNGHCLIGHVAKRDQTEAAALQVGRRVTVDLTPFDLSRGRIRIERTTT